jgi:hypothetical protein
MSSCGRNHRLEARIGDANCGTNGAMEASAASWKRPASSFFKRKPGHRFPKFDPEEPLLIPCSESRGTGHSHNPLRRKAASDFGDALEMHRIPGDVKRAARCKLRFQHKSRDLSCDRFNPGGCITAWRCRDIYPAAAGGLQKHLFPCRQAMAVVFEPLGAFRCCQSHVCFLEKFSAQEIQVAAVRVMAEEHSPAKNQNSFFQIV